MAAGRLRSRHPLSQGFSGVGGRVPSEHAPLQTARRAFETLPFAEADPRAVSEPPSQATAGQAGRDLRTPPASAGQLPHAKGLRESGGVSRRCGPAQTASPVTFRRDKRAMSAARGRRRRRRLSQRLPASLPSSFSRSSEVQGLAMQAKPSGRCGEVREASEPGRWPRPAPPCPSCRCGRREAVSASTSSLSEPFRRWRWPVSVGGPMTYFSRPCAW